MRTPYNWLESYCKSGLSAADLADEAFGHLDEVTANALRATFSEMARRERKTTILVTHQL